MKRIKCVFFLALLATLHNVKGEKNSALESLIEEFWNWRLDNSPEFGTKFGVNNHDDKLEEMTEEAFSRQKAEASVFLERVNRLKEEELGTLQEKFNRQILKSLLENYIDGYRFKEYSMYNGLSTYEYPLSDFKDVIKWSKFNTEKNYQDYLSRLDLLPIWLQQKEALMQKAIDKKITQPIEALTGIMEKLTTETQKSLSNSLFYAPFNKIPASFSDELKSKLQADAAKVINEKVKDAWLSHKSFMEQKYLPNVRADIGASSLPNGSAYYAACLKWHLSVEMDVEDIHSLGLEEVARINNLMKQIMANDSFNGTLTEYKAQLAKDTSNFYPSSEAMLNGYKTIIDDAHNKLPTILNKIPQAEVSVQALYNSQGPTGRYSEPPLDGSKPGIFWANVFNAETKPKFNMIALALHEAEPGHHTQTAIAIEENLPKFRRAIEYRHYTGVPFNWQFHTSYSEGWALYAEKLGEEMGIYTDNKALFGRYASEIHRACRLVVDTGMHAKEWSKQRAIDYLTEYTTLGSVTIENEINRYISWPGQACAYKIGEIRISKLREKAETQLGGRFNLKAFHDEVLKLGNAPLYVLEQHINEWIKKKKEDNRTIDKNDKNNKKDKKGNGANINVMNLFVRIITLSLRPIFN